MLWPITVSVKLLCIDSMPSIKRRRGMGGGWGVILLLLWDELHFFHSRCPPTHSQTDRPDDSGAHHRHHWPWSGPPSLPHVGFFFLFPIRFNQTVPHTHVKSTRGNKLRRAGAKPRRQSSCRGLPSDTSKQTWMFYSECETEPVLPGTRASIIKRASLLTVGREWANALCVWHTSLDRNESLFERWKTKLVFSKCSYVAYQKTGQGLVTGEHTSNTCKCVHANADTHANNKELHMHRVTLETFTNKHMCAHGHTQARTVTYVQCHSHVNEAERSV